MAVQAVVLTDLPFEIPAYLLVAVEAGTVFGLLFLGIRRDRLIRLVHPADVHRNERGVHAEKTHLHADVLGLVALVHEQVVYLADLLAVAVVDLVTLKGFYPFEPVIALFVIRHCWSPCL